MSKPTVYAQKRFSGGIADFLKENANGTIPDSFYFGRAINYRDDPQALTLLPGAIKESGLTVIDLLKWGDISQTSLTSYFYGDAGNIYSRSTLGNWTNLHTVANSHGNGLSYFAADDNMYYTSDQFLGRYGPTANVPTVLENWQSRTIDTANWIDFSFGAASAATGQLIITQAAHSLGYPSVLSSRYYNIQNTRVFVQAINAGNQALTSFEYIFLLQISPGNELYITINQNLMDARKIVGGSNASIGTAAYVSSVHKYLAISESNGIVSFETSQDGVVFTPFVSVANPFTTTSFQAGMQTGFASDEASSTTGTWGAFGTGPVSTPPQFSDNFLSTFGGVPQNTSSFSFLSSGSQYLSAADSVTLSQTGDITLETFFKANTLPAVGSAMTLLAKWTETGNLRSYSLDLLGVSGYFGNGSDGPLTISSNTTEVPIDSVCSGIAGTQVLTATNASFAAGQVIKIYQTQGTNAGQYERALIQSYTTGTITTATPLLGSYTTGAQVRVIKQYTDVTINAACTYSPKAWTGALGGDLVFLANGTFTNNGTWSASGKGFLGATTSSGAGSGIQGEGYLGAGTGSASANGNGGGAGVDTQNTSGGGGGLGTPGQDGGGSSPDPSSRGKGGSVAGSIDLTTFVFGGGGGSCRVANSATGAGGNGGGGLFAGAVTFVNNGTVVNDGLSGQLSSPSNETSGGSGSGGPILVQTQSFTNNGTFSAIGGVSVSGSKSSGGTGGVGRIHVDYLNGYTAGTAVPTIDSTQNNSLVTSPTIQARLGISNNGTSAEYLTKNLPTLATGAWNRLSVSWDASASLASFYLNALPLGTTIGTKTAIADTTSLLYIGATNTSLVTNYFNGLQDDIRIWGNIQSAGQILANNQVQLTGSEAGLVAYYKANNALTDSSGNSNTLTNHSTTYSTDVPFSAPTTRLDIDQEQIESGDTYALPTAISESAANMLNFTPEKDPQASVAFTVAAKGTGNWTVVVHDQQNNVIAQQTIANASLPSAGAVEFIYGIPWSLVTGKTYHMHLISTVADGTIVSDANNDLQTASYTTYFGFLVPDSQFHPIVQFQYQPLGGILASALIIGNGHYLATWDGSNYNPNFISFPAQWKVRCFAFWREFLAIGVWKGGNIYDFDQGRIYFWDGIAPTWNFFIPVPEGQVNAMFGVASDLYLTAGYRGQLLDYQVASSYSNGNSRSTKVKRMPLISAADYTEVLPGAMNYWRGLLHLGLFGNSNSTTMQRGTYSYGTQNQVYPETLGFDYALSTGNVGNTVSIGLVYPVGQTLIVGWRDGIAYGADQINFSNPPAPYGEVRLLLQDDGSIWHNSANFQVRTDYLTIQGSEYVESKFSLDRAAFITTPQNATADFTKLVTPTGRGNEYMIGANLFSDGTNTPTILGLALQRSNLNEEEQF